MSKIKSINGNFFEDFALGQNLIHGVPRTITESDSTLYLALTGSRFALHCASTVATNVGFLSIPIDNFLLFHIAFGKTVNDISLNAVANLGYAEVKFHHATFAGDTINVSSKVIGLKENSSGKTGVVYVHSKAYNQNKTNILEWKRWVMVKKNRSERASHPDSLPDLLDTIKTDGLQLSNAIDFSKWSSADSDEQTRFNDISIGDIFDHRDGMTINDSDHSMATRLYQNNARVHFDQAVMDKTPAQKRLVYGGHIISICRSLSYNGLANAVWLSAINGGTHSNPCYAGDTIYSQSKILDKQDIQGRKDLGLVRIQLIGTKNTPPESVEQLYKQSDKRKTYHPDVVLDLDYNVLVIK